MRQMGHVTSGLILARDRVTETGFTLHPECLASLRALLEDAEEGGSHRMVEMGPAPLGCDCNLAGCVS